MVVGVGGGSRMPYQEATPFPALCIGSLILLSTNYPAKVFFFFFAMPSPLFSFIPVVWTYKSRGKCCRTLGGIQSSQHSSNHLIRAVFDECAEWRWSREAHGVAHCYRVLIRSIRDTAWTLYRTFLFQVAQKFTLKWFFSRSHGGAQLRHLHCRTSCRQWPRSVLTGPFHARLRDRPRCWAHVSWPSTQQQQEAKHSPNGAEARFWCCINFHFQPLLNLFLFNSAVLRLLLLWRQRWIIKLKL